MSLLFSLNARPLLRPEGARPPGTRVCLIAYSYALPQAHSFVLANPEVSLCRIAVPDFSSGTPEEVTFHTGAEPLIVPVCDISGAVDAPELEKVFFAPREDRHALGLEVICRALTPYGVRHIGVWRSGAVQWHGVQYDPDFYRDNEAALERVADLFNDEESRNVYAARVKAVLTGNPGYLPVAAHQDYYHPLVRPEEGDVLIDGGVSDMVSEQRCFAEWVGANGRIYGFEPVPGMYARAAEQLGDLDQYTLMPMGLGMAPGEAHFTLMGDSSRVSDARDNTVACAMTSIDAFVAEQGIERVDCIKLDVEGSELAALMGARKTIAAMKPRLIVCLYHKKEDLYEIPPLIKRLAPEYELYLSHSSCSFLDTVLYARPGPR